jgi:hypothetical protein
MAPCGAARRRPPEGGADRPLIHLIGTLVGIFVTSSGILLAADTAVVRSANPATSAFERKLEITGDRSGAVFTGSAGWEARDGRARADFRGVFRDASARLRRAGATPVAVQAETLAAALRREAESNVFPELAASFPDGDVLTVLVAGYDGDRPAIHYARIRIAGGSSRAAPSFVVQAERVSHCWLLAGKPEAALGLLDDDPRLPGSLRQQPSVLTLRAQRGCQAPLAEPPTRAFFLLAVDATAGHGPRFGIPPGAIGGDVDVLRITAAGVEPIERVPRL